LFHTAAPSPGALQPGTAPHTSPAALPSLPGSHLKELLPQVSPAGSPLVYHPRCLRNSSTARRGSRLEGDAVAGVLEADPEALLHIGRRRHRLCPSSAARASAEDPWIPMGPPRDHDPVTSRFRPAYAGRLPRTSNVPVSDDRNRDGLLESRDLVPPGLTGVHVRARARMQADGLGPRLFTHETDGGPGRASPGRSRSGS
jgi:hypothetical protein